MTKVWTPAFDALFEANDVETVASIVGVSVEAAARRLRRIRGAQFHIDREEIAEVRKTLNVAAWQDRLLTTIKESAKPVAPLPRAAKLRGTGDYEHLLMFSDLQYGEKVTPAQTGGLADYNSAVAEKRLGELLQKVIRIRDQEPCKRINITGLGDYIEGTTIYPSQSFHVDKNVVAQTIDCANAVASFVRELAAYYPEVVFDSVLGNHGRIDKAMPVNANMDMLMMKFAEALVARVKNVTMRVHDQTWYAIIERFGIRYMLVHGDDMRINEPSMEKFARRWRDLAGVDEPHYLLIGHHHRSISFEMTRGTLLVNGSFVGPSEYSLKTMALGGSASQTMLTVGADGILANRRLTMASNLRIAKVFRA